MDKIEGMKIPDEHLKFAKAVQELAGEFDLDSFTITYKPKFNDRFTLERNSGIHGEIIVHGGFTDGRGRPHISLRFECKTTSYITNIE